MGLIFDEQIFAVRDFFRKIKYKNWLIELDVQNSYGQGYISYNIAANDNGLIVESNIPTNIMVFGFRNNPLSQRDLLVHVSNRIKSIESRFVDNNFIYDGVKYFNPIKDI